jgi:predicted AlkP superfamily phosphohydrolase/phosphomutase
VLALFQFDAAALPLVEAMLADGRLPVIADLKRRGKWHPIDGRTTILQSSTYPTLCTGIDVREHGIYSAVPWSAEAQRPRFMYAMPRPATISERLTRSRRRALVIDPYLAWAPTAMEGVYLSGWQFQDRMVMQRHWLPPAAGRGLRRTHGSAPKLDDVYGPKRVAALMAWRRELVAAPGRVAAAAIDLLRTSSPFEVVWLNFATAHKSGHHLWDPAAVAGEPVAAADQATLQEGLSAVYAAIDAAIGRVLTVLPSGTDVIVFSPTGMGPNTSRADLLPGMLSSVLAGRPVQPESNSGIWSLRSRIPPEWRAWVARALPDNFVADLTTRLYTRVDWSRTRAVALPGENKGYIRVNLRGRERLGIVDPVEASELMHTITCGLLTFRDPDGSAAITKVERMTEIAAAGSASDRLPDLVVHWGERPGALAHRVTSDRFGAIERSGIGSGRSGNHDDQAWAVVVPGASRRRDVGRPITIMDIGATACALAGADGAGLSGSSLLE